ncbi:S1 RNA-binding domain-containing protein [Mycoplasmopsis primatum]|uniref:S1 RNA-binding domain-containing protein n=1 Tax=Mycoplasmopsis primatum TaxID=55604 RepID=UPI000497B238|nr:S1 RNA-binding domain-containing protein [Mycoplasmopsis primatum]
MIKTGDILNGLVKNINTYGIVVWTFNNMKFFIPSSLVTDFKKMKLESIFEIDQKINFIVESVDIDTQTGIGNFKGNHPRFSRAPFKNGIKETKHGFNKLHKNVQKQIDNYKGDNK